MPGLDLKLSVFQRGGHLLREDVQRKEALACQVGEHLAAPGEDVGWRVTRLGGLEALKSFCLDADRGGIVTFNSTRPPVAAACVAASRPRTDGCGQ